MGADLLERPRLWTPDAYEAGAVEALRRSGARSISYRTPIREDQRDVFEGFLADRRDAGWSKADCAAFRMAAANKTQIITSSGLTTATTAYVAGDQVGAIFTFTSWATGSGLGGLLTGMSLYDETDIIGTYSAHLYSATVTAAADNAAFSVSDSDSQLALPGMPVTLGQVYDEGPNRITAWQGGLTYNCGVTSLFALLRTEAGHTFFGAATSLKLALTGFTI